MPVVATRSIVIVAAATTLAVAAAIGVVASARWRPPIESVAVMPQLPLPREASVGEPAAPDHARAAVRPLPTGRPPAREPHAGDDPRSRVTRLIERGGARDALRAHAVLAQCVEAREFDRFVAELGPGPGADTLRRRYGDGGARIAAACADLSARELEQRLALAARAADDGVPGAASAWVEAGPFGDASALSQRPDDPLVVEWAQHAIARITAATKRSDIEAIGQFGLLCLHWDLDDVARLALVVDAGVQRRREDAIRRLTE